MVLNTYDFIAFLRWCNTLLSTVSITQVFSHDAAIAALKHALQSAHMAEDAQTGIRGCVADSTGGMSGDVQGKVRALL